MSKSPPGRQVKPASRRHIKDTLMHELLAQQLRQCFGDSPPPPEVGCLLERVDHAYHQFDAISVLFDQKYRGIFENASDGIFQTTPDGHYLSANPALAEIYGYASPNELVASISDIKRQLYVEPGRRDEFVRLMDEKGEVRGFESRVYRK